MAYYIGIMSGTSFDAIDTVLVDFNQQVQLLHYYSHPIPDTLRQQTIDLNHRNHNDLAQSLILDRLWGELFADAVNTLIDRHKISKTDIRAIGSHGQTIRHSPNSQPAYTLQIGDPNTIAELTHIDVVADFRRRDIAAGGQGAPLAPAFHQFAFASQQENRAIINIGGMANITLLQKNQAVTGFDSGPGNVLMNAWIREQLSKDYDNNGDWASAGHVDTALLNRLLSEPFFSMPPPKSTGRELFDLHWLKQNLTGQEKAEDVQATLAELTAHSICTMIPNEIDSLYICGGGAYNSYLLARISAISGKPVQTTATLDIDPNWLEAIAFAWFAKQTMEGEASSLASVTGAKADRILGGVYQA